VLASSVRALFSIQEGFKYAEGGRHGGGLTNMDILKFVQDNKHFAKSIKESLQYKKFSKFISPSNAGGLYYLLSKKSAADCAQFFHEVNTGEGLKDKRAAFMLREKLISMTGFNEVDKRKVKWLIVLYTIQAWNAFRSKKPIERFVTPHKFDGYPEIL
jgi:hypothetical protein